MNIKAGTAQAVKAKVMTWKQFESKFKATCDKAITEN